jgi:peptide/nickel transport system substrate-binding protein
MRRKLWAILVLTILVSSTSVGCGCSSALTILSIAEGNVYVMKAGTGNWIEAQEGMSLEEADAIKTDDNSSAEITFSEGSTVELQAGTEVEIASLDIPSVTGSATIVLGQTIGTVVFRVTKIVDPASRYEVDTPTGVVAVRGSAVEVHVTEDGTTRAVNLEGDIWASAQGVELQIPQGQQCTISPGQPPRISSFVQMTIGDVDSLDPAWAYDGYSCEQVQYVYETLLFYDGEEVDQFVPALATEWQFDSENLSYRFKIRKGVKFHEGGDLTPSDVEYSFEREMVQDRAGGPSWQLLESLLGLGAPDQTGRTRDRDGSIVVTFDQIDNAVEVDGDSVQFNLADPRWGPVFLQILCNPWASIVDKEWCIANGEWDGTEETWQDYNNPEKTDSYIYNHTDGTGPWKLEEWDPGLQIKLVRNDDYWRELAAFESVTTRVVEDWTTRKEALLAGDADLVYVQPGDIGEVEGIEDLNIYQDLPEPNANAFFFNFNIAGDSEYIGSGALDGDGIPTDFFTDINVRKGFNYAFDWETYIEDGLMGGAEQRGSPIIKGFPFYDPNASMYSLDLTKAEEHLRLAWDGELWENGCNFTLVYVASSLEHETACKILAENLYWINPKFQVSIQPIAFSTWWNKLSGGTRDMPMFQIGWGADYPHPDNFVVPFMASYGVYPEWQSHGYPELDELIEAAFDEPDPTVQQDMYYELQERYYEDAPAIMLCQSLGRRCFTKYIEGFYYNPFTGVFVLPLYYMSKSSS